VAPFLMAHGVCLYFLEICALATCHFSADFNVVKKQLRKCKLT